jgi:hypothetical protein
VTGAANRGLVDRKGAKDRYGLSTDEVVARVKAEFGDNTDAPAEPRDTGEEDPPWPRQERPPTA